MKTAQMALLWISLFAATNPSASSQPKVGQDLILGLKDKDPAVREKAAASLMRPGSADDRLAVPALIKAMKDVNGRVRIRATDTLYSRAHGAEPLLPMLQVPVTAAFLEALQDTEPKVRGYAVKGLGFPKETEKVVVAAISKTLREDQDSQVRVDTAIAVGNMKEFAKPALPHLLAALRDPDKEVRKYVAFALANSRRADRFGHTLGVEQEAMAGLLQALKDEAAEVRCAALYGFSFIGPLAKAGVPAMIKALQDPDKRVRACAAQNLRRMDRAAHAAIPALTTALQDSDEQVRQAAAATLKILMGK